MALQINGTLTLTLSDDGREITKALVDVQAAWDEMVAKLKAYKIDESYKVSEVRTSRRMSERGAGPPACESPESTK